METTRKTGPLETEPLSRHSGLDGPLFAGDMEAVIRQACEDLIALQDGGVDSVLSPTNFLCLTSPRPTL